VPQEIERDIKKREHVKDTTIKFNAEKPTSGVIRHDSKQ
jgi:hypothetical protein